MLSTLTLISFVFALAWAQQIFLNRMIAADIETLKKARYESLKQQTGS